MSVGNSSLPTISVPANYGFCVLVAVGSVFVLVWKGMKVGRARKQFDIPYPTMYHSTNTLFNCYQRAHQNTLENYPQFLMLLLLGGLEWPIACAAGGTLWLVGRVLYANGYYTGDPKKRLQGGIGYIGLIPLLAATTKLGLRLTGVL